MDWYERITCWAFVAFVGLAFLFLVGGLGFVIATPVIEASGGLNIEVAESSRTGVVRYIGHTGAYWKTWEGELDLSPQKGASRSESWDFSVVDADVVEKLQAAQRSGARVVIRYKRYWLRGWRYGKTDKNVFAVEEVH